MAIETLTAAMWKNGTGGTYAAFGRMTEGFTLEVPSGRQRQDTAGGTEFFTYRDVEFPVEVPFTVTDVSKALILLAQRASHPNGALEDSLMVQVGNNSRHYSLGNGASSGNCVANSCRLSWSEGQDLICRMGFLALSAARTASGLVQTATPGSDLPYKDGTITVTVGAADLKCFGFEAGWENNYKGRAPASTRATNAKRFKTDLEWGLATHSLSLDVWTPLEYDLVADAPTTDYDVVITAANGATTLTMTYTNVLLVADPVEVRADENGNILKRYGFDCPRGSLVVT